MADEKQINETVEKIKPAVQKEMKDLTAAEASRQKFNTEMKEKYPTAFGEGAKDKLGVHMLDPQNDPKNPPTDAEINKRIEIIKARTGVTVSKDDIIKAGQESEKVAAAEEALRKAAEKEMTKQKTISPRNKEGLLSPKDTDLLNETGYKLIDEGNKAGKAAEEKRKAEEAERANVKAPLSPEEYAKTMPKQTGKEQVNFSDPQIPSVPSGGNSRQVG